MRKIEKIVKKYNLKEQPKEYEYWLTQPYQARLAAVEEIIREYHGWKPGAEPGFQRVYRVIKRK